MSYVDDYIEEMGLGAAASSRRHARSSSGSLVINNRYSGPVEVKVYRADNFTQVDSGAAALVWSKQLGSPTTLNIRLPVGRYVVVSSKVKYHGQGGRFNFDKGFQIPSGSSHTITIS